MIVPVVAAPQVQFLQGIYRFPIVSADITELGKTVLANLDQTA